MKYLFSLLLTIFLVNYSEGQLSKKVDKFTGEVQHTYNTSNVSFNKYVKGADTTYQTSFFLYDTYLTASGTDAILLFSDNTTIELKGEVDVDYSHNNLYMYTFYTYEKDVVELLSNKTLKAFKLHIFDKNISTTSAGVIKVAAKKILVVK
jgi:hypothetical protein